MELEISPDPDPADRAAILAALEADDTERSAASPWADALLPRRDGADGAEP